MRHELLQMDLSLEEAESIQDKFSQKVKSQEQEIIKITDHLPY